MTVDAFGVGPPESVFETGGGTMEQDTVVAVSIIMRNETGADQDFYPDQNSTLILDDRQYEVDFDHSDDLGGTYFDGAEKDGYLIFGIDDLTWQEVEDLSEAQLAMEELHNNDFDSLGTPKIDISW